MSSIGKRGKMSIEERLVLNDDATSFSGRKIASRAGTKRIWWLVDAREGSGSEIWQAYVKRRGSSAAHRDEGDVLLEDNKVHTQDRPPGVGSVIVFIWER
ncbi:hypothetical protein F5Y11DRAFT_366081 [Daldinia sp. FL1419]|nr:hypothetical protein F5Y11DRAFT_366081 [Daldinia sp. FL1419]